VEVPPPAHGAPRQQDIRNNQANFRDNIIAKICTTIPRSAYMYWAILQSQQFSNFREVRYNNYGVVSPTYKPPMPKPKE
jgi:hypothetical protein